MQGGHQDFHLYHFCVTSPLFKNKVFAFEDCATCVLSLPIAASNWCIKRSVTGLHGVGLSAVHFFHPKPLQPVNGTHDRIPVVSFTKNPGWSELCFHAKWAYTATCPLGGPSGRRFFWHFLASPKGMLPSIAKLFYVTQNQPWNHEVEFRIENWWDLARAGNAWLSNSKEGSRSISLVKVLGSYQQLEVMAILRSFHDQVDISW